MPIAILIIVAGVVLSYSAFKGIGVTDLLAGSAGDPLDPSGPGTDPLPDGTAPAASATSGATPLPGAKNSNALQELKDAATNTFHLTITSTTGGTHVPTSWHYKGRAFDAAGKASDMAAFWEYARTTYGSELLELFYDPKGAIKNGAKIAAIGGHSDHVHVAI